jgi:hypothetical protein
MPDLLHATFKQAQKALKKGDLFLECETCGKVPRKTVQEARKIGNGPSLRAYFQFDCPGCGRNCISYLWRK